ncbi:MAG: TonB-dependent receptor plug domain-containing protein, partial [Chitinophagales bacterium]
VLHAVEVKTPKIRQVSIGGESQTWDSDDLQKISSKNIADFLNSETGIFIKSYGLGSLATSSARGGSASHTLVLWNGLPIQSPMLGLLDLSLLPIHSAEKISVQSGGASAMWGSGAVGGIVSLQNTSDFSKTLTISSQSTLGSFGNRQQTLQVGFGNERFQSKSKLSYQEAANDFFYEIHPDLPKRQQTNAAVLQKNFLQDIYFKINPRQKIAAHFWLQNATRQIPPTNVQNLSQAYQDDKALRLVLDWQRIGEKSVWNAKAAYFKEDLGYHDPQIGLAALSDFSIWMAEVDGQFTLDPKGEHRLLVGTTHSLTKAFAEEYRSKHPIKEYKGAVFARYQGSYKDWTTQFSLRQELVAGNFVPLVPIFGVNKQLGKQLEVKMKVSKNYRLPTMNDRFWQPGGNPDLLAENGWSQEATIVWKTENKEKNIRSRWAFTGFNRNMDNWILWSKLDGNSFWSASNITKVWSRGFEARLGFDCQLQDFRYEWKGAYHFTHSTNQIALELPEIAAGQQLFYTPKDQVSGTFGVHWKQLYVAYQHRFTGSSLGVNEDVEAYHLGQVRMQYGVEHKKLRGNLSFTIENLWDASYFVIERRPMAGRYFQMGLDVHFK